MSLAWLFCLGWLVNLGAALADKEQFFLPGALAAGTLFGAQAGCVVLLEFDHWRSYYGRGALGREAGALLLIGLAGWGVTHIWPPFADTPTFLSILWLLSVMACILVAPYLAAQAIYLLLGEPLNFQHALQYYYQRRWPEVIRTFEPLVKQRPRVLRPQLILASAYFNLRQFDRARNLYQRMLERDPQAPGAWQGLAELDFTSGAWEQAAESYTRALAFSAYRRRGFILIGLGIALYKLGRANEAAGHLKKALNYPLSVTWRPIAAYALLLAARDSGDSRTAEGAMQRLALAPPMT